MTWRDKLELGLREDAEFRRDNLPPDEVHGPEEATGPHRSPVVIEARDRKERAHSDAVADQDSIDDEDDDTTARSADMDSEGQGQRHDTHVKSRSRVGIGVDAQQPDTMPRAEDDAMTGAGNRDVNDQAGSGDDIARRRLFFSPPQ